MLTLALLTSISTACTTTGSSPIIGLWPAEGSTDVPIDSRILAEYGLDPMFGEMVLRMNGEIVPGSTEMTTALGGYMGSNTRVLFTPEIPLTPDTLYAITVDVIEYDGTTEWVSEFTTSSANAHAALGSFEIDRAEWMRGYSDCEYDYSWETDWRVAVNDQTGFSLVHLYEIEVGGDLIHDRPFLTQLFGTPGEESGTQWATTDLNAQTFCLAAVIEDASGQRSDFTDPICHERVDDDESTSAGSCSTTGSGPAWLGLLLLFAIPTRRRSTQ